MPQTEPRFFDDAAAFRSWPEANHARERALVVGFYKKGSGRPSITWPESVDEALCFGWIDGSRRARDTVSYTIRFTPRTASSNWRAVNIRRMEALVEAGRGAPAGLSAFAAWQDDADEPCSYVQSRTADPAPEMEAERRAVPVAWAFFAAQLPGYRRTAAWWAVSATRQATRGRPVAGLIRCCTETGRLGPLTRPASGARGAP